MSAMGAFQSVPQQIANKGTANSGSLFSSQLAQYPQIGAVGGRSMTGPVDANGQPTMADNFNPEVNANAQGANPLDANQFTKGSAAQSAKTTTQDISQNQNISQPIDTLGLGGLVHDTAGYASALDSYKNQNLSPLATGEAPAYKANSGKQIASALSGPQSVGAGQEANIRNASEAATNANIQNANTQIAANGATGTSTTNAALANAVPYLGSEANSIGNTLSTGLANAFNTNYAVGAGPTSTSNQSSGGGSIICTALESDGLMSAIILVYGTMHRARNSRRIYLGYRRFATIFLQYIYKFDFGKGIALAWARHLEYLYGGGKFCLSGKLIETIVYPICYVLGGL